jgi:hypothetical protein
MPGWNVRRYRAPIIRFDGRTWRIKSKTPAPNRMTRFELEPWEPNDSEIPGPEIEYSAGSVTLRDHADELGRQRSDVTGLLGFAPIRSLTGFLWARTKDRLETEFGIDPVRSTTASVMIQWIVAFGAFVLSSIAQVVRAFGYDSGFSVLFCVAIAVVAALDAGVRWSSLQGEERPPVGFYEWLLRRR